MKLSSIRTKLAVVGVIPIVLFLALIIIYLIPVLEETIFHEKEIQTMEMVNTALGIIENLHQKEMQGELSRQEAQERAMESIASMTFGEDRQDYFWINDYVPNMVMHPFRPDLDGEYIGDFQDPDGLRLFQEMVEAVERHDAGYVEYQWQYYDDQDRIEPKLSYVAGFEPWEWIVGTGVYIHDVQQIAGETRNTSLFWTGVIVLVVGAIVVFFIINILKPLMRTISFVEGMSKGELGENLNIKNRDELGRLSSSLNEVQNNINAIIRDVGQMTQSIRHGYIRAALSEDRFRGDYARLASDINHVSGTLASYLETLPISAMTVDDECTVLWMNEKGVKESKTDPVGRKCHEIFGKEGCGTDTCATKKCMSTGSQEYDESSLTVGGKTCYMAYYSTPVKSSDGRTIGAFEVQVDLTEIKLAQQKIQESAERAMSVSDSVSSACDELAAQVEQTSRGTEEQTNRIGETATSMEEMNATVLEVARNASGAAEQADEAKVKAEEGAEIVRQSVEAINEVQEQTRAMKESLNTLGRQSEEIGKVMTVIDDIADQTNLLALNAAIEAARAGDAGRGFAVVADEVRKLAEKTMNATKEVEKTVTSIQESTNSNVENMEQATRMVERATELANSSGHALKQIVNLAQEAADQVRSIATASEEQSSASEEVNRSMEDVNRIARETTDAMNQSAQAVSDLAQQASELQKIIEDLKKT